jgi:hypothetical protein
MEVDKMETTIYILEYVNGELWQKPRVFSNKEEAIKVLKKDFNETKEELGIPKDLDNGEFEGYQCILNIIDNCYTAQIIGQYNDFYSGWRVSEHKLDLGKEK